MHQFSTQQPRLFYNEEVPKEVSEEVSEVASEILASEVMSALKNRKSGRTLLPDAIHIETLNLLKEQNITVLTKLYIQERNTPQDWLKSIFIPRPGKYYTSVYIYKNMQNLDDAQFGFLKGIGIREALSRVSILLESTDSCLQTFKRTLFRIQEEKSLDISDIKICT